MQTPLWDELLSLRAQKRSVFCRYIVSRNWACIPHRHQGLEFTCCLSGQGFIELAGRVIPFEAPALLSFPGSVPHSLSMQGVYERWNMWVEPSSLSRSVKGQVPALLPRHGRAARIAIVPMSTEYQRRVENIFGDIAYESLNRKPSYEDIICYKLGELLTLTNRMDGKSIYADIPDRPSDSYVAEVLPDYIEANLNGDVSASTLAEAFHYSEEHIYRLVRRLTGHALGTYVKHRRVDKACALLKATTLPVKSVGVAVGLPNPQQFSRTFRELKGMSPSDFREIARCRHYRSRAQGSV